MLIDLFVSALLLSGSALFSGLTLGYFTLETGSLKRRAKLGDMRAAAILPLRSRGNHLLTTLLLGNVAVNSVLAIFLGELAGGLAASLIATALIFLFGEILPQAVISRNALRVGSVCAPFVQALMWVSSPVTYPIARTLDRLLGEELPTLYSRHELMEIIAEHEDSEHSTIDADEERILHGALNFSHLTVREVMTPWERVVAFDENRRLTHELFEEIGEQGYSRYPIYSGTRENVVGILFAKNLLTEDPEISIKDTEDAFDQRLLRVKPTMKLDVILAKMLKERLHLALVESRLGAALGVITLEDIIEEIIQIEIEDEEDEPEDEGEQRAAP
ncbi:DUF21 domain-containing protein [Patescibacteria group bacterium]|jgi:metal transporter CNNM|nr:DUF21 domain-containing protein [Patescibacteria group bacterium]